MRPKTKEKKMTNKFNDGRWSHRIDVADFVYCNITPYDGDSSFLQGPTERTKKLWNKCLEALEEERQNGGVRAIDAKTISTITSHAAGYIDRENELIVGLQTDELLKRAIKPFGGWKVVDKACKENGIELDPEVKKIFTHYRKTHNDGVFDVYTEEIRKYRSLGFLTGLPDNYSRGRIIGDYRRLALYGIDRLIEAKKEDLKHLTGPMTEARVRLREEVSEQIRALGEIKILGEYYGLDLSRPATSAQEAVQWVYMAYLASVKEQDGAAMSLGNVSSFLDIFIQYDLDHNLIDESFAQELIDQFVMKLRMVRHLRMGSYNDLFAGDPTWITESIGGRFTGGKHKVTKTSFRFLQTLYNLGPAPEPNMTVLWHPGLPEGFKTFCAKVSIDTSSVQYENDSLMRKARGCDDYGIACCVSYQAIGKAIQFFGARANLAKALLLAINGGRCENTGTLIVDSIKPLKSDVLDFDEVMENYKKVLHEVARVYNETMNIIHYMHDKYDYEKSQMAFIDTNPTINLAYGVAGLSIAADSLSAIKYAKVTAHRNADGLTDGFSIEGDFPICQRTFLLLQRLQELNLYDAEFVAGLVTIFGLEEVEFACFGFHHLHDLSESIALLGGSFQADGNLIGQNGVLNVQMDVAKALFGIAFPDELLACKDFNGVAALAPTGKFHADVIHCSAAVELVGNPSSIELAIVAPFAQFVVVETVGSCFLIDTGFYIHNLYIDFLVSI